MKLNPGVFLPEGELIGSHHSGSAPNTIVVIEKYQIIIENDYL